MHHNFTENSSNKRANACSPVTPMQFRQDNPTNIFGFFHCVLGSFACLFFWEFLVSIYHGIVKDFKLKCLKVLMLLILNQPWNFLAIETKVS